MVGLGGDPAFWPTDATLGSDCGLPLGEGDAGTDGPEPSAVVPTSLGEAGVVNERPGAETDFVFSEQRGQVVMVLVIKLVTTMIEVVPPWTLVVVTGQLAKVV